MAAAPDKGWWCRQQYLAKNPAGYCRIGGTGVTCPISVASVNVSEGNSKPE